MALPGSQAVKPARVRLFGCTDRAQGVREGKYIAAANRYRRRIVTFRTELEGLIPTYGDLIALSHDIPRWGLSGEVLSWDSQTRAVRCSEPLSWQLGAVHYLVLRKPDGSVSDAIEVTQGATASHAILKTLPGFEPQVSADRERTHFAFGVGQSWSQLARVMSVKPRAEQVELTCVAENALVHTADQS